MEIKISPSAWKFIVKNSLSTIVLTLMEMETGDSLGIAKDVNISYEPPPNPNRYRWKRLDEVDIFIDRRLEITETVTIKKQGVWRFAGLYADGIKVPI